MRCAVLLRASSGANILMATCLDSPGSKACSSTMPIAADQFNCLILEDAKIGAQFALVFKQILQPVSRQRRLNFLPHARRRVRIATRSGRGFQVDAHQIFAATRQQLVEIGQAPMSTPMILEDSSILGRTAPRKSSSSTLLRPSAGAPNGGFPP